MNSLSQLTRQKFVIGCIAIALLMALALWWRSSTNHLEDINRPVLTSIYSAVSSPIARKLWDGVCGAHGLKSDQELVLTGKPDYEFVLDFN